MDGLFSYLLGILFIYTIYFAGKFLMAVIFGVHEQHLFLGFGKHPFFTFTIKQLKVSLGLFIPFPGLAKYYSYFENQKERIRHEWEFFHIPIFKRLLVTFGGVIFMLFTSIIIFSILEIYLEDKFISKEELNKNGIYPSELAREKGFEEGDIILTVNGRDFERSTDLFNLSVLENDSISYQVKRNNDTILIHFSLAFIYNNSNIGFQLSPSTPLLITSVLPGSEADRCGLRPNDVIHEINGVPIKSQYTFIDYMQQTDLQTITMLVERDNTKINVQANISEEKFLGIVHVPNIKFTIRKKTLSEALLRGIVKPYEIIASNSRGLYIVITGQLNPRKSLTGPIGVAQVYGGVDWNSFFYITAILMSLTTLFEFLPVPKSSAMRAIPLLIEAVSRKQFTPRNFKNLNRLVWVPIIALMVWIIFGDIVNLFY